MGVAVGQGITRSTIAEAYCLWLDDVLLVMPKSSRGRPSSGRQSTLVRTGGSTIGGIGVR